MPPQSVAPDRALAQRLMDECQGEDAATVLQAIQRIHAAALYSNGTATNLPRAEYIDFVEGSVLWVRKTALWSWTDLNKGPRR